MFPMTTDRAMLFAILSTEVFTSMEWDTLTADQRQGAMLLFEACLKRCEPLLIGVPGTEGLHEHIAKARKIGEQIRTINSMKSLLAEAKLAELLEQGDDRVAH